ncbi:MAG: DUF1408 domain-containing protein, partial [Tetragenococcus koreensis]|nr:DUF1408 domain-containing protein [Tetragenococcus koreensis]
MNGREVLTVPTVIGY